MTCLLTMVSSDKKVRPFVRCEVCSESYHIFCLQERVAQQDGELGWLCAGCAFDALLKYVCHDDEAYR